MPGNMRLLALTEAPTEETPPSTRPSSAASNSTSNSGPQRSTSMDSIHTSSSFPEKPSGEEIIPTRITRQSPKVNVHANMQFVKTKPAALYKSAREQIEKAEAVKALRKTTVQEEEEWQSTSTSQSKTVPDEQDWQSNLDKWKSNRRKRNEVVLERVIEVKKYEQEAHTKGRRKSKTFSEMQEEKNKRGRRYNFVVHNDDNDLGDLGLTPSRVASVEEPYDELGTKDVDNKDTKSDAGFCTGSDTGSDGVFAEDNISDTSSALGDKKEVTDSLPDTTTLTLSREKDICANSLSPRPTPIPEHESNGLPNAETEYTYDKAIEDYKQFAENSAKKRSSSVTSLSSNSSCTKADDKKDETASIIYSKTSQSKINDKLSFFTGDMVREERIVPKTRSLPREKLQKVDINKRRSMFELRDIDNSSQTNKPSVDVPRKLKNKVASFENILEWDSRTRSKTPPKDAKFKEKLDSFNQKERDIYLPTTNRTLQRDQNFYQKLQNFSKSEKYETKSTKIKAPLVPTTSLKQRIASFERRTPERDSRSREKSVSMECLTKVDPVISTSSTNLVRMRAPSTPFLVVEVNDSEASTGGRWGATEKRRTVYEEMEKFDLRREISSAPIYSIFNQTQEDTVDQNKQQIGESSSTDEVNGAASLTCSDSPSEETCFDSLTDSLNADEYPNTQIISSINYALNDSLLGNADIPPPDNFQNSLNIPVSTAAIAAQLTNGDASSVPIPNSTIVKDFSLTKQEDSMEESLEEFGDADIDEVFQTYELLSDATTVHHPQHPVPSDPPNVPEEPKREENVYENIFEEESTYENIYEKVKELPEDQDDIENVTEPEHHYQTLEDVKKEVEDLSPPLPPKKSFNVEVLDVTWTEDDCRASPAAPPSMPPPPPPPEEEVAEGEKVSGEDMATPQPSSFNESVGDEKVRKESSTKFQSHEDVKKEIRLKRSSFLGTTPQVEEELSIQPPPDMKELLRQERDAERQMIQNQANKEQQNMNIDFLLSSRTKYTWEDRMRDDTSDVKDTSDTSSNLDFQFKLAELELEMETHDRNMLQRMKISNENGQLNNMSDSTVKTNGPTHSVDEESVVKTSFLDNDFPPKLATVVKPLPIQEFYTAPAYGSKTQDINCYESTSPNASKSFSDSHNSKLDPADVESNPVPPKPSNIQPPLVKTMGTAGESSSGRSLSKQSIKALSAIPKPRLIDNDSWIAKRKPDSGKRDYNSHWLIQEAEQRRLDSMGRYPNALVIPSKPTNLYPPSQPYTLTEPTSHTHTMTYSHSNHLHQPVTHSHSFANSQVPQHSHTHSQLTHSYSESDILSGQSSSNLYANLPSSQNHLNQINNNFNSKKQGRTYSPPKQSPSPPQKPLPESIINTITQRVTNKSKINNNDRPVLYTSRYNNQESHHDYMNTENIDSHRLHNDRSSVYGSNPTLHGNPVGVPGSHNNPAVHGTPAGIPVNHNNSSTRSPQPTMHSNPPGVPISPASEEQRLLSVSGKKKCSHCCEELGRGAAMIIESLRLFYHIPCFKCCVCGIQLGNGSSGADVRVRNHKLHCHNCYSNDEGMKFSKV